MQIPINTAFGGGYGTGSGKNHPEGGYKDYAGPAWTSYSGYNT